MIERRLIYRMPKQRTVEGNMKKAIFLILIGLLFYPLATQAVTITPKFSIDPASPSIDGNITPDDVLQTGPVVLTQGSSLGLQDSFSLGEFDNLNALSYGRDPVTRPGTQIPVYFSVDRVAVGLPGSAVNQQAQPGVESAAGDVFRALPPAGSNTLAIQGSGLGPAPGFFGDDLDGLELDTKDTSRTYFSIDSLSFSNGVGALTYANDIFLNSFGNTYASGEVNIGLYPMDDLDALVLWDVYQPGILNPGIDMALFFLSTFSPNTFTAGTGIYSPADILFTDFRGSFALWASAESIGLRPDDELNALDTVPEPSTILLMAVGFVGIVFYQYRLRRKSIS